MSELIIRDGEPIDVVADTSLDGTRIEGRWEGDEFHTFFTRDGKVIAGFTLGDNALNTLSYLLRTAIANRGKI